MRLGSSAPFAVLLLALAAVQAQAQNQSSAGKKGLSGFNPEIGVVADIVGRASEEEPDDPFGDDEGIDRFSFREAQLVFGAFVDPFMRADFAFVFSDSKDSEIEEAYLSFLALPGRIRSRVGKFRSKIGKVNLKDLNALQFVNEPLVIQEYLGKEGMSLTGLNASRIFGLGPVALELTGEFFEGGQDVLFSGVRGEPIYVGHLKGYVDFTPRSNFEVGLSYVNGDRNLAADGDPVDLRPTDLMGIDLTYKWKRSSTLKVWLTGEGYRVDRDRRSGDPLAPDADGGFLNADVRFAPRWSAGARYDRVEPLDLDPAARYDDRAGYAVYATFHQSEFARIRLQYQLTREPDGFRNDEVYLQFRAQIGVDRHGLQ